MHEDAVAEHPAGAVERPVGVLADDAVDEHAAPLLERADGALDVRVEQVGGRVVRVGGPQVTGRDEALADGLDGRPAVASSQRRGAHGGGA
ncbi:hypothetical protein GCM10025868_23250 [Angustibacter aerolatus]|uniref:Uncharacterized protein n=1 Tax=Angustibacter aerolatus TaxID=1162965 RepID=A0ABQ6JFW2_9ACTN|nr:hypothetical protein GCM10025868_23250 [Angustibacter aerolatus]